MEVLSDAGGWAMMGHSHCTTQAMTEEQLKAFMEAAKADEGLQMKLKAAEDTNAVVAIAKEAGFSISAGSWLRAAVEISEEELEGVAGGLGLSPTKKNVIQYMMGKCVTMGKYPDC